jgi:hypothetical protein
VETSLITVLILPQNRRFRKGKRQLDENHCGMELQGLKGRFYALLVVTVL